MQAQCHCKCVSLTLDRPPEYINLCDCSLCLKTGGAWGYFDPSAVAIQGETSGYRRKDYDNPAVEIQFCPVCGVTTHWILTEHIVGDDPAQNDRMGVNMRLFDPSELSGIEARTLDGRNWFGGTDPNHRRPPGKMGVDVFP